MIATALSDGLIIAGFVAFLTLFLSFLGWVAREMYRTSSQLNRLDERTTDQDRRLVSLESIRREGRP